MIEPRVLYPAKLSIKSECRIKTYSNTHGVKFLFPCILLQGDTGGLASPNVEVNKEQGIRCDYSKGNSKIIVKGSLGITVVH